MKAIATQLSREESLRNLGLGNLGQDNGGLPIDWAPVSD